MQKWIVVVLFCFICGVIASATGENDTPAGASTIELNAVTTGTVCRVDDPIDWWKVYVSGPAEIVVFVDGSGAGDIDLHFYDGDLALLAQSTGSGPDEVVYGGVRGGRYYIKVSAYSSGCISYYIGVLAADASGYLAGTRDFDVYRVYLSSSTTYWIFLTDHSNTFDPDLFLATSDGEIIAESDNTGNIDVIRYTPTVSGYYLIAAASASGSGYYWLFIGSR